MTAFYLQPTLTGSLVRLRPLLAADHDALFAVASDPLIWEQHPDKTRSQPDGFRRFFQGALDSGGAFVVEDLATGKPIGSSRYDGHDTLRNEVEMGWTFLAWSHWGGRKNGEMKRLMIGHALRFVSRVVFLIHPANVRSQTAIRRIGATRAPDRADPSGGVVWVFEVTAVSWIRSASGSD